MKILIFFLEISRIFWKLEIFENFEILLNFMKFLKYFNDSLILITIISCDYLNEHVGDVTMPPKVIEYSQNFLQTD
jgi:hypothetical protein